MTDLLAPHASTQVIKSVMMNAMMSGGRPNTVPNASLMLPLIDPPANESKLALRAQAQAEVPIKYSKIIFQPMTKATNSPTDTYEYM